MTTRPITLRDWQVRAALAGNLSLIVVPLKWQPPEGATIDRDQVFFEYDNTLDIVIPPHAPGDLLWVREGHALVGSVDPGWVLYRANGYEDECGRHGFDRPYPPESVVRWRSPVAMPRWASRTTLRVKSVEVKRVQEIAEDEAIDTGVYSTGQTFVESFGPATWAANPWCAFVAVEVINKNVGEVE